MNIQKRSIQGAIMLLVLMLMAIRAHGQVTTDNIFTELIENTDHCIYDGCYAIYEVCNPDFPPNQIPISSLKHTFTGIHRDSRDIKNSILIEKEFTWNEECVIGSHLEERNKTIINNKTEKIEIVYYNVSIDDYGICKRVEKKFIDPIPGEKIAPGTCEIIKIQGYLELGDAVDWVAEITINGVTYKQRKWAWWNASKPYRRAVNDTEIVSLLGLGKYLPLLANGTTIAGNYLWFGYNSSNRSNYAYYNLTNDVQMATNFTLLRQECENCSYTDYENTTLWIAAGLTARYDMSSPVGLDRTGHGFNNVSSVVKLIPGRFDKGVNFTGSEKIVLPDYGRALNESNISFEFWIYRNGTAASLTIFSFQKKMGHFNFLWPSATVARFFYYNKATVLQTFNMNATTALNTWEHWIIALDTSGNVSIYLNAVRQATGPYSYPIYDGGSEANCIGGWAKAADVCDDQVIGTLDEFRIWNKSLTENEVKVLYNNSLGTAGYGDLGPEESNLSNTAPSISKPTIYPATAYTDDNINASATPVDVENITNDGLQVEYIWRVNTVVRVHGNISATSGNLVGIPNISSGNFSQGDIVNISLRVWDGKSWGARNSSERIISNHIPTYSNQTPANITFNTTTVNLSIIVYDNDLDLLNATAINNSGGIIGAVIGVVNASTVNVTWGNLSWGTIYEYYWNITDNYNLTNTSVYNFTIQYPPDSFTPLLYPSPVYTSNDTICNVTYLDPEGQNGTIEFRWYVNSVLTYNHSFVNIANETFRNSTLGSGNFTKNQIVNCTVILTDTWGANISNSTAINVSNTLPLTPSIAQPVNNYRDIDNLVTLNCSNSTDGDGDPINYYYYGNGTFLGNGTIFNWGNLSNGTTYNWTCNAYDGENHSSNITTRNFTENTNPTAIASISPASPGPENELTCTYSSVQDAEGDTVTFIAYNWHDGSDWIGHNSSTLSPILTSAGETWKCAVNLSDSYEIAMIESANVTLEYGCLANRTWQFDMTVPTSINWTLLNFSNVSQFVYADLSTITTSAIAYRFSDHAMLINTTTNKDIIIYIGDDFTNVSYSTNKNGSQLNVTIIESNLTQLNPYYFITFTDEMTLAAWNMSQGTDLTLDIVCSSARSSEIDLKTMNESTIRVGTKETPVFFSTSITYASGSTYYRRYVPESAYENLTIYMIDLVDYTAVLMTFELTDLTGSFSDAKLEFQKYLGGLQSTITSDIFEMNNVIYVYLIANERYIIDIDNGEETRQIGWVTCTSADTDKTITIFGVGSVEDESMYRFITVGFYTDYSASTVALQYNSSINGTNDIGFFVYNNSNDALLYEGHSSNENIYISFVVPNQNWTYRLVAEINHTEASVHTIEKIVDLHDISIQRLIDFGLGGRELVGLSESNIYMIGSIILITSAMLVFGAIHSGVGVSVGAGLTLFLVYIGWIAISYTVVALMVFIAFFAKVVQRRAVT